MFQTPLCASHEKPGGQKEASQVTETLMHLPMRSFLHNNGTHRVGETRKKVDASIVEQKLQETM